MEVVEVFFLSPPTILLAYSHYMKAYSFATYLLIINYDLTITYFDLTFCFFIHTAYFNFDLLPYTTNLGNINRGLFY